MLDRLGPNVRGEVEPIVQRWSGFIGKLEARIGEIVAEADAGLSALIVQHPTDHGPLGAAFSAVKARFHGLGPKLDDAFDKTEEAVQEVIDADPSEADQRALDDLVDALAAQKRALAARIELASEELEMRKNADWARRLQALAEGERAAGVKCSQCGAAFAPDVWWRSCQVPCGHCQAVNDVHPGVAAGYFYQGLGVHALSHEAAWGEWLAEQRTKDAFDARRHPTAADRDAYLDAARAYYTKYYQTGLSLHPELAESLSSAVEAKLAHYRQWDQRIDQIRRDFFGRLVDAAARGDSAALVQLGNDPPDDVGLEDCIEALVERGLSDPALVLIGVEWEAEGEDGDRAEWCAERLADVRRTVRG